MKTQLKFLAICHLLSALCWVAHGQGTAAQNGTFSFIAVGPQ